MHLAVKGIEMLHEIKLIKIHTRNLGILVEQGAILGLAVPVHIQNQISHEKSSIEELEKGLQRRLQLLLEKAAVYGLSADPSISIEIEDIQEYFGQ